MQLQWHKTCQKYGGCQIKVCRNVYKNREPPSKIGRIGISAKDLQGNPKPRVSPDRTGPKPVQGQGTGLREFFGSGRVGEFYFGSVRVGEFYFGSVRVGGIFFYRVWDIFSWDFRDKLAFHSQTEELEWLLSLISTLFDEHIITSLQGIFTCLL